MGTGVVCGTIQAIVYKHEKILNCPPTLFTKSSSTFATLLGVGECKFQEIQSQLTSVLQRRARLKDSVETDVVIAELQRRLIANVEERVDNREIEYLPADDDAPLDTSRGYRTHCYLIRVSSAPSTRAVVRLLTARKVI